MILKRSLLKMQIKMVFPIIKYRLFWRILKMNLLIKKTKPFQMSSTGLRFVLTRWWKRVPQLFKISSQVILLPAEIVTQMMIKIRSLAE